MTPPLELPSATSPQDLVLAPAPPILEQYRNSTAAAQLTSPASLEGALPTAAQPFDHSPLLPPLPLTTSSSASSATAFSNAGLSSAMPEPPLRHPTLHEICSAQWPALLFVPADIRDEWCCIFAETLHSFLASPSVDTLTNHFLLAESPSGLSAAWRKVPHGSRQPHAEGANDAMACGTHPEALETSDTRPRQTQPCTSQGRPAATRSTSRCQFGRPGPAITCGIIC